MSDTKCTCGTAVDWAHEPGCGTQPPSADAQALAREVCGWWVGQESLAPELFSRICAALESYGDARAEECARIADEEAESEKRWYKRYQGISGSEEFAARAIGGVHAAQDIAARIRNALPLREKG